MHFARVVVVIISGFGWKGLEHKFCKIFIGIRKEDRIECNVLRYSAKNSNSKASA